MKKLTETEEFVMTHVLGKRVVRIRPITPDESERACQVHAPCTMVLELENGTTLFAPLTGTKIYGEHNERRFKI